MMTYHSATTVITTSILSLCMALLHTNLMLVSAYPYNIILTNETPLKCFTVDYPQDAKLEVIYNILDFKSRNAPSMTTLEIKPKTDDRRLTPEEVMLKRIDTESGKVLYDIPISTPELEICLSGRNLRNNRSLLSEPLFISVYAREFVEASASMDEPNKEDRNPQQQAGSRIALEDKKPDDPIDKDQIEAHRHLSELDMILKRLVGESKLLLTTADLIKNEEATAHQHTIRMHSAMKWWPIIHLCVLFATGFTQANHMVRFFKSRHII